MGIPVPKPFKWVTCPSELRKGGKSRLPTNNPLQTGFKKWLAIIKLMGNVLPPIYFITCPCYNQVQVSINNWIVGLPIIHIT